MGNRGEAHLPEKGVLRGKGRKGGWAGGSEGLDVSSASSGRALQVGEVALGLGTPWLEWRELAWRSVPVTQAGVEQGSAGLKELWV